MVVKHEDESCFAKTMSICSSSTSNNSSSSSQFSLFGPSQQLWEHRLPSFARIAEVINTVVATPVKKGTEVLDNAGLERDFKLSTGGIEVHLKLSAKKWCSLNVDTTEDKVYRGTSSAFAPQLERAKASRAEPVGISQQVVSKCGEFSEEEEVEADEEQVVIRRRKDEALKSFICGGVAGIISRTAVAPLDLIKTHLITSHGTHYRKSGFEIFLNIWKTEGWQGLFRGNSVNCIRVAPCKAIELCVFETVKKFLIQDGHSLQNFAAPLAGGAAGMAGTLVTYPLELIRTRISVQPHCYSGLKEAILKICKEEGFFALYAGLTPSIVGVFPYAATNYFVYDGLRSSYCRTSGTRHVPTGLTLLFGAVAAAASSAITYPLEVARRQMQLGSAAMLRHGSTTELVRHIYREEGFLALYRGLGTSWLKLIPAAGISFVCYEAARSAWESEMEKLDGKD